MGWLILFIIGLFSTGCGIFFIENIVWRFGFIIVGGLWILSGGLGILGSKLYKMAPLLTADVKVIAKFSEQDVYGGGGLTATENKYIIVFEFPDRSRKNATVDVTQYSLLLENDFGTLEYKELTNATIDFVSFRRLT